MRSTKARSPSSSYADGGRAQDHVRFKNGEAWVEIDDVRVFGRPYREISFVRPNRNRRTSASWTLKEGTGSALLFGSTTQQLVRGAMCPVLTVRGLQS